MITRTSNYSRQIQIGNSPNRSTLNLIKCGVKNHISINITGPKGGNQRAIIVSSKDVLKAIRELFNIDNDITT